MRTRELPACVRLAGGTMVRRRISRDAVAREPHLAWNAFIDLVAMEEYEDLDPVQRVAHLAFWYDSEVQNGGHLQYFENRGTDLLQATIDALDKLGAEKQREVLSRAGELYQSETRAEITTAEEYADVALEGEFDEYDEAYHSSEPAITDLLQHYLENHRENFLEET